MTIAIRRVEYSIRTLLLSPVVFIATKGSADFAMEEEKFAACTRTNKDVRIK